MAITSKEAIKKAKQINPKVNRAVEYSDAFGFENTGAGMHFGGNDSFIIMKETGKLVTVTEYMLGTKNYASPKRIPMSSNAKRTKKQ